MSSAWDTNFLKKLISITVNDILNIKEVYMDESEIRRDEGDILVKDICKNNILHPAYLKEILKIIDHSKGVRYTINQKTPLRVLHRRPNIYRERNIELLRLRKIIDSYELIVRADAGTYIKEFINGDFGRTSISLSALNNAYCDCIELDVIKIED